MITIEQDWERSKNPLRLFFIGLFPLLSALALLAGTIAADRSAFLPSAVLLFAILWYAFVLSFADLKDIFYCLYCSWITLTALCLLLVMFFSPISADTSFTGFLIGIIAVLWIIYLPLKQLHRSIHPRLKNMFNK